MVPWSAIQSSESDSILTVVMVAGWGEGGGGSLICSSVIRFRQYSGSCAGNGGMEGRGGGGLCLLHSDQCQTVFRQ